MSRAFRRGPLLGAVVTLWLGLPHAQAQSTIGAREHYDSGLKLIASGDIAAAAREFEAAYRISPNDLVLYNLGQARLELGDPARALEAFQGYLRGAPNLSADRRSEVNALIALCKRQVGRLAITVEPAAGEVFVDGRPIGKSPLPGPVSLSVGRHEVSVDGVGFIPFVGRVDIERDIDSSIMAQLNPTPAPLQEVRLGQLSLSCSVPDALVSLDGKPIQLRGTAPVILPVGHHRVSWDRAGYEPSSIQLLIRDLDIEHGACDLRPQAHLGPADSGMLYLVISQSGAQVQIDGRRSSSNVRLPRGSHSVRVQHQGYLDWSQSVNVAPGLENRERVSLVPTAEHAARAARVSARKNWAYVFGGAGLTFLGSSAALYLNNEQRYSRWATERDGLNDAFNADGNAGALNERASRLREDAVSIQRRDDLALGMGIVGVGLVTYAVVSWLSSQP